MSSFSCINGRLCNVRPAPRLADILLKGLAMLTINGRTKRLCDGVSRRSFLKIGGFALGAVGGVTLADILRAEAVSGRKSPHKAVINIFLAGGPPHQDMWE